MRSSEPLARDPRRGAALFVVILFSAFVAALAAAATRTGLSGARAAAAFADGVRADELGRGAAAAVAYRVATGGGDAKRGGAIGLRLPGADLTIDYLSESARVDANLAPVALISALAAAAGSDSAEAEGVAARIDRFRAEAAARARTAPATGDGAPAPTGGLAALRAAIDALGPATKPKPAAQPLAIRDVSEITQAWGLSDALARRLRPFLTVSNGTATVDPVLAARPVVLALLGADERADDYIRRRAQGFVDKDSALALLPVPARDFVAFQDVPAVRALVRVRVANRLERRYEMIMAPPARAGPAAGAPSQEGTSAPSEPDHRPAGLVLVSWRKLP